MFNYDNIGSKIKGLAKAGFIVEAIAAVVTSIVIMVSDDDLFFYGLLVMFLGPIIAWVASWLLYGFGQLIENSDIMAQEYNRKNQKYKQKVAKINEARNKQLKDFVNSAIKDPVLDEETFIDITCPNCKAELSFMKGQLQSDEVTTCPLCDAVIKA